MLKRGIFLLSLLVAFDGSAATDRFNSFDFWPTIGPSDTFSVSNGRNLFQWQPAFSLTNTYAWKPIQIINAAGTRVSGVVDDVVIHFVSGGLGLTDGWQVGITFPIASLNRFTDPNVAGASPTNYFDIGDLRVGMKFRLWDVDRHGVGMALETFGTIPTGRASHFMGEGGPTGGGRLILDFHLTPRFKFFLNAGAVEQRAVFLPTNIDYKERFLGGIGATIVLNDQLNFLAEATTATAFKHFYTDTANAPTEWDAGFQWRLPKSDLTLSAGGGTCIICNAKAPSARAILGMGVLFYSQYFSAREAVHKKVTLWQSKEKNPVMAIITLYRECPSDPAHFDAKLNDPACPKFYELKKEADRMIASKIYVLKKEYSAKEVVQIYTLIAQELSQRCPLRAEEYRAGLDDAACPKLFELQKEEAVAAPTWVALEKFSRVDSDEDGIVDVIDQCPEVAGTFDLKGCPSGEIWIPVTEVLFTFNSARLTEEATKVLGGVAILFAKHPEWRHINVEGRADSIGSSATNLAISRQRAERVIEYLRTHGIPATLELTPIPMGAASPLAPNSTLEGRARNRQVTFRIPQ